jgi:hypothetical protein
MSNESPLTPIYYLGAARNNLERAERWVRSGDAVNWIAYDTSAAIHNAIDGWLTAQGIVSRGGWQASEKLFRDLAPEHSSRATQILCGLTMLDYHLHGTHAAEHETGHERWSTERCVSDLACMVARARAFITTIEAELRTRAPRDDE